MSQPAVGRETGNLGLFQMKALLGESFFLSEGGEKLVFLTVTSGCSVSPKSELGAFACL